MTTQATHRDARSATYEFFERAWQLKDADVLVDMAVPHCAYHVPDFPVMGNREFLEHLRHLWQAMPDLRVELLDVITDGNEVACRARLLGTQTGDLHDVPPTGLKVDREEMTLLRWDGHSRLVSLHQEADNIEVLVQLGAMPSPDAGPTTFLTHAFVSAVRFTRLRRKARKAQ
ncbi:ester cyclase [Streptomyces sp. NBC_00390]|uniref:ester cyclase n=1 Tax=Streptomyces sp. NBC_00390 TaxID=2975736 RepID=UPI002E1A6BB7